MDVIDILHTLSLRFHLHHALSIMASLATRRMPATQGEGSDLGKGFFIILGLISQANPRVSVHSPLEGGDASRADAAKDNGCQAGYGVQACFGVSSRTPLYFIKADYRYIHYYYIGCIFLLECSPKMKPTCWRQFKVTPQQLQN